VARKLIFSIIGSLREIFPGLNNDSRISGLNLNVVNLPESRPDPSISDFLNSRFHHFQISERRWGEKGGSVFLVSTATKAISSFFSRSRRTPFLISLPIFLTI